MARLTPKLKTIRVLFAKTGNQCAFAGCTHSLINEFGDFIAQVCHIEAAEPGGERYNEHMTDEDRRSANNLLVLCYQHHVETNRVDIFDVKRMQEIKINHEKKFSKDFFDLKENHIKNISNSIKAYWNEVQILQETEYPERKGGRLFEIPVEIDTSDSFLKTLVGVREGLNWLEGMIVDLRQDISDLPATQIEFLKNIGVATKAVEETPYYDNPFHNFYWEVLNIGAHNLLTDIKIGLERLELKFLEESFKNLPNDKSIENALKKAKGKLINTLRSSRYAD